MSLHAFADTDGWLTNVPFSEMVLLRQRFARPRLHDYPAAITLALAAMPRLTELPAGSRIAVAVGSRGIADLALIVRETVAHDERRGSRPLSSQRWAVMAARPLPDKRRSWRDMASIASSPTPISARRLRVGWPKWWR